MERPIFVILHDVRSVLNVGSIFRTADAAGVKKLFLTGYTPGPVDRFGRVRKDMAKAALGAEAMVPWEALPLHEALEALRREGARIVAVEQDARALAYTEYRAAEPLAFIFGNEPDGLPAEALDLADDIIDIPMHGKKESLNVSVAAGIILFKFREGSR